MLLGSLAVSIDAAWADKVDEKGNPIINYITKAYLRPEDKLADMIMVKEQNGFQLWYEEFTGEVAIIDTATGNITFTNPYDIASGYQGISEAVKQKLLSQLIITFLESGVEKTMNSYQEAALRGQITKKNIKNGIRVEYILGEEATTRLVPRLIRSDRFEELILANITAEWQYDKLRAFYTLKNINDPTLTERGVAEMLAKFPIAMEMAVYVCDPEIKARELRELETIIKTYCPTYTYESLDYDHEITNYTGDDAAPPRFRMSLEYTLSEDGLEVRLPANGIEFDESVYQFQDVSVLPYFGAGSNEFTGYSVIPDGSGSLIRFEDFKGKSVNISGKIYGADYAYHEISGQHSEAMRMPYYGVVTYVDRDIRVDPKEQYTIEIDEETGEQVKVYGDGEVYYVQFAYNTGFLAIITEGDSLASLMAECGGTLHPYSTVYPIFTPRPSDEYNLADSISVSGNASWTVTSNRKYTGSYRIKYVFLRDEEVCKEKGVKDYYTTDWVGMATAYRDYLTDTGTITKFDETQVKEDIPLFIETFGSIETTERIASFPVTVDKPITSFDDIKTMYTELTELGVGNVNFKLRGYANGGFEYSVPYRLKWTDVVGGGDGFAELAKYAAENNFEIYPDFDFTGVYWDYAFDGFSLKRHAVRTIDDRYTVRRTYNAATQSFDRTFAVIISPSYFEHFYDHFSPLYAKYGNDSISVASLGYDLNSDFDEDDPYHREDSKEFTVNLLEKMSNDYNNIMVEGGNIYAVKYADVILNASLTSSKYTKASESIPFLGMVLHGSKVFTGSATNMEGDINIAILNAIENGAAMYFILSYQNTNELKDDFILSTYYSVSYDIWKDDVVKYYTILNDATKDLQTSYIVDHEFIDAQRIPDEDEAEADRLAAEAAAQALAEQEAREKEKEETKARRKARIARENGEIVDEIIEEVTEELTEEEISEGELNEFGELIVAEEEDEVVLDKYLTTSGSVVRVEYEGGVNFILNYNSFDIKVEWDGNKYEIPALDFVRID